METLGMKLAGCLLLLAGWIIVLAAVMILTSAASQTAFVIAGLAVEVLGFVLMARVHRILPGESE